jgi:hypothetical protein
MTPVQILLAVPIWWVNGALAILYWIIGNLFTVISNLIALVIAFGIDPFLQSRAVDRPRRYERGASSTGVPSATYLTLGTAAFWTVVSLTSQFPVPLIGLLLWLIGLFAIMVISEERFNQLWWVKAGIITYGMLVIALRLVQFYLAVTDPTAWASFVGTSTDAQVVLESTRHNFATIGILFVFVLYPLGFTGMLLNRALRNPKPNFNLFTEAGTVLRRLRTRAP